MRFETPAALWGLLSLLLLVLFSLWRQAAVRTPVSSLLLWKLIPERNPPLRALRRPRWRPDLLLQALALAAIVAALAGPFVEGSEPEPRKFALVFDTSARMLAGDKLRRAKEAAQDFIARLGPRDRVSVYWAVPDPRRGASVDDVQAVHVHVDPAPMVAAARQETPHVILFSDRPIEGVKAALFSAPGWNVGIVDFSVTEGEAFVRIVNHGESRKVPILVRADGAIVESASLDLAPGTTAWALKRDFSRAKEVRVGLDVRDSFALDDRAGAVLLAEASSVVSVQGADFPLLVRAFESIPGVTVRRGGGAALVSVGVGAEPSSARLKVAFDPPRSPFAPGTFTVAEHPLTRHLRAEEIGSAAASELAAPAGAEKLFFADGRLVGALWDDTIRFSFELTQGRWSDTPSFPIFWTNVIDYARRASGSFVVARTGRSVGLPVEVTQVDGPEGGAWSLSPSRSFTAWTVGEFRLRAPGGERPIRVNLLDERESDTAGEERPLEGDPADPARRTLQPRRLAGSAAVLALVFLVAAWLLQRLGD